MDQQPPPQSIPPPQPVVPPPSPSPAVVPGEAGTKEGPLVSPAKPKNVLVTAMIVIVVLLSLSATGFFAYKNYQFTHQVTPTPTPTPIPSPTPTPDPTANWEMYTNTKYFYSFKYPVGFAVGQNGVNSPTPEKVSHIVAYSTSTNDPLDEPRFSVSVTSTNNETLQQQMNTHFNIVSKYKIGEDYKQMVLRDKGYTPLSNTAIEEITQIDLLGKIAYEYIISGNTVNDGASEYLAKEKLHKYVWFQSEQNIFLVHFDNITPTNQILSTFTFVDQNNRGSQTGGQQVNCPAKRPQVCTMECAQPPPYICGSDGKSYCSVCQACSGPGVSWYVMQATPCEK